MKERGKGGKREIEGRGERKSESEGRDREQNFN